jgi:hypothetical protein
MTNVMIGRMGAALRASILTIGLLVFASVALGGSPASVQKRLEDVRVCGAAALDKRAAVCTRDESGKPIVSSAFYCSARAQGEAGERFVGRFLYRGQPFPAFGTSLDERRKGVNIYLTAGPNPMPGGSWSCELRVGTERIDKPFQSGGPSAPILHVAACRSSRTVLAGPVRVCRRDESSAPFPASEAVTCSAVFAGGKGKLAGIDFLREGKEAFSADFELPLPVTAAGPRLDPDPKLQSGRWACRWSLAGRVVAVKQFRIQ